MKPINYPFLLIIFLLFFHKIYAQTLHRGCYTNEYLQERIRENPTLIEDIESVERHTKLYNSRPHLQTRGGITTIPVVVHIVYRTSNPEENISEAQVLSQLAVLNKDYRRLNLDRLKTPSVFKPFAADCGIEFQLAKRDPKGNSTNGIMRYPSNRTTPWGKDDDVKMPLKGGVEPWNASKYLNIWVCSIGNGVLGYSTMPGATSPMLDGVVIDSRYFGTTGTAISPFDLGRTTTHEVGHWLNLMHLWADADCGDDHVSDTPTQFGPNYTCPNLPHFSCGNTTNGDMFMNFMDYTDDACMNMFSQGQKTRIEALFSTGGKRASLLLSDGLIPVNPCVAATNISIKNITSNAALISWSGDTSNHFSIDFRKQNTGDWLTFDVAKKQSIALSNLQSDTTYEFKINSYCIDSQIVVTKTQTFTTLQDLTICKDVFEPNNTFSSAKPISTNRTIMGILSSKTDLDFYQFANTEGVRTLEISLRNLSADYDLYVYDRFKQLVDYSTKTNLQDESIIIKNAPIASYYIRVLSRQGENSATCYQLKVTTLDSITEREKPTDGGANKIVAPLVVSPNPVSDVLTLDFEANVESNNGSNTEGVAFLTLHDLLGRSVEQKTFDINQTMNHLQWDVSNIPDGFYLLMFQFNNRILSQKILINKP
jgi:Pregnancy-associated plasma protein-A/Secretion system C-terminal sorting domain/Fibronectin type III domain